MEITSISSIRPFKYTYCISVQVCKTWRAIKFGAEKLSGLHCIMVDQQGSLIHGFMTEDQVKDMNEKPLQGQMYEIHQFSTRQHCYDLRVVENFVIIHFNRHTIFCKVPETIPRVPAHCFRLIQFAKLDKERVRGCSFFTGHFNEQVRETITIVFWGKLAREFDVDVVTSLPSPVLAVFTGLKMVEYKHRVVGNNYEHMCVLLNPPTSLTDAYKAEPSSFSARDKFKKLEATARCFPEGGCYMQCFKMEELDNKYKCKTHGVCTGIPCFRVNTLIGDEFSDVTVTVMGNQAEQLFGCKLEVLRSRRVYVTEQTVPPEISAAIGQIHIFEVKANTYGEWIVVSVEPAKEDATITPPVNEAATSSTTLIPELTLQTSEKTCTEKKRAGEEIKKTLFADGKKTRRESEEISASSSAIDDKEKLD